MTAKRTFFDGHNDFLLRLMKSAEPREDVWLGRHKKGHLDLARMKESGFAGGLFAIFVPPVTTGNPLNFMAMMAQSPYDIPLPPLMTHEVAQPTAMTMAGLMHWMERTTPDEFKVCRSVEQLRDAMAQDIIAGVMHMEGAEAIGPDLDALYLFYEMGLRSLGPVWSRPTIFGEGVPMKFPGHPDIGDGLTEKGKDLIRLCNELGVLIDLSHMNEAGFNDIADISTAPLVASHSNVHAISQSPRNLTDRQLDQIRESGGMVGFNFATFFISDDGGARTDMTWEPLIRHMDHLIAKLGEDHVGLGSDFDGCVVPKLIGDVTGVPDFLAALKEHGYDEMLLGKIAKDNWINCLERTLKS